MHSTALHNNPEGRPDHPDESPDLSEPVGDILDLANPPCGPHLCPTPMQYRDTLRALWLVLSGQGWAPHPRRAEAYAAARHTGLPNFLEARVPLPSALNMGEWRVSLADYPDTTLADHITSSSASHRTTPQPVTSSGITSRTSHTPATSPTTSRPSSVRVPSAHSTCPPSPCGLSAAP